jgi:tripartite-type tricarboxylate transporter receptor subunit TctC
MKQLVMLSSALLLACGVGHALAQADTSYPQKPVRIVVPWAAGGNADVLTRVMARNSWISGASRSSWTIAEVPTA